MSMPKKIWVSVGLLASERRCSRYSEPYVHADIVARLDDQLTAMLAVDRAKDAEIERLRKALDQAIDVGFIRICPGHDDWLENEINCSSCFTFDQKPELAAYLRERDSRPPSSGVQSGVQGRSDSDQNEGETA